MPQAGRRATAHVLLLSRLFIETGGGTRTHGPRPRDRTGAQPPQASAGWAGAQALQPGPAATLVGP